MWGWSMGMWGAGLGMLLWTVVVVAVIAVAVVLVVRGLRTSSPDQGRRDTLDQLSPEDELRRRFARGQMDSEEFRRRMQDLRDA